LPQHVPDPRTRRPDPHRHTGGCGRGPQTTPVARRRRRVRGAHRGDRVAAQRLPCGEARVSPAPGTVRTEVAGNVGWVTISNPARHNALSTAMMRTLGEGLRLLDADPSIRVI